MKTIAQKIGATVSQVEAAVTLMDEGATVPFIARYRKEVTQGLDDAQLRALEKELKIYRALEARRAAIIKAIKGQVSMSVVKAVKAATSLAALEAIYAPFKSTRKTRADEAREKGCEPLAQKLLQGEGLEKKELPKGMSESAVREAAIEIVIDDVVKDVEKTARLAKKYSKAPLKPRAMRGKKEEASKWLEDARIETPEAMPGHRALGLFRAMREGIIAFELSPENPGRDIVQGLGKPGGFLQEVGDKAWKGRVGKSVESRVLSALRSRAEEEAIVVFEKNLRALLMAAPAGPKRILGLDPGLRTGTKAAVIGPTGSVEVTGVLYPQKKPAEARRAIENLDAKVDLIALGNGTGSREMESWLREMKVKTRVVIVSEAGASVYSASELASRELPDLDVSLRGAVSIARRLQDPLAELVKIDPKALGIGQYQHDITASLLEGALSGVIQDVVASVGVDVNTASPALLAHVPGIGPSLAKAIVEHREEKGAFASRVALKKVKGLGAKAFEQAAGFLRIFGKNPLDATAIHPESYKVVEQIARKKGVVVADIVGDTSLTGITGIKVESGASLDDILEELARPGRDPRPQFRTARLDEAITTIEDLEVGMRLEGTVSNVAAFGAFVDLGVHCDGLVHISELSDNFVSNPSDVVSVGDIVRVRVLDIDKEKERISLSMKPERISEKRGASAGSEKPASKARRPQKKQSLSSSAVGAQDSSPFAALAKLKGK